MLYGQFCNSALKQTRRQYSESKDLTCHLIWCFNYYSHVDHKTETWVCLLNRRLIVNGHMDNNREKNIL